MSSVLFTGTVAGTYHGLSGFPDDPSRPQQVVVTVQMRQGRPGAPLVLAALWCGTGAMGEKRASEARAALVRGSDMSMIGEAVTYYGRANTLNLRGLECVRSDTPGGRPLHFDNLRPETPEPTTTL